MGANRISITAKVLSKLMTQWERASDVPEVNDAHSLLKGFLQIRPTLPFLPGAFLAEKAFYRHPTPPTCLRRRSMVCPRLRDRHLRL